MSDWQSLGVHRYCIVDGIFWLETNGELGAESAHSLVEILIDLQHQRPDCATLVDVRGGISLPASTRKILAGYYRDTYRRTPAGWRFTSRELVQHYNGAPDLSAPFPPPPPGLFT